jgi:hypothetical protein
LVGWLVNYGLSLSETELKTDKWEPLLFLALPDALNPNKQDKVKMSVKWRFFRLEFGECLVQTLAGLSVIPNEVSCEFPPPLQGILGQYLN